MSSYLLLCKNDGSETKLCLTEKMSGIEWVCVDGESVWGTPSKGRSLGSIMANGHLQLSDTDVLSNVSNLTGDSHGTGLHGVSNGGSFPEGEFEWKVCKDSKGLCPCPKIG